MIEHMRESMIKMRREIEGWKADLAKAEAASNPVAVQVAVALRAWIAEGEKIIADSGF